MTSSPYRLQAQGISKSFGALEALSEADLALRPGTVHALFGANGAGKSTLVKVITGVHRADRGELRLNGEVVEFSSPSDARARGIAVVFQDPPLFGHLSVAENVFAGAYPTTPLGLIDASQYRKAAVDLLERLHIALDPDRLVQELSVAEREFVAIARALRRDSQVLILDEPTAALTPQETRRLFDVVRKYRTDGGAVLFISHRLEEAGELADDATVFRDGRTVLQRPMSEAPRDEIIEAMLGRALEEEHDMPPQVSQPDRTPVLSVRELSLRRQYREISFDVHAGEIVALAGLIGSGRTEILETLIGLRREDAGEIHVNGAAIERRSPRTMAELGAVLMPEDRDAEGLVYGFSISDNIAMPNHRKLNRGGWLRRRAEASMAQREVQALSIRTSGVTADVASLSGGNRQKVVLGKWLASAPSLLLLDEPTKGVDVGAKAEIHNIIRGLARTEGMAVVIVTSDFEEVVGLADRVLVMRSGSLATEIPGDRASAGRILAAASTSLEGRSPIPRDDEPTTTRGSG